MLNLKFLHRKMLTALVNPTGSMAIGQVPRSKGHISNFTMKTKVNNIELLEITTALLQSNKCSIAVITTCL